MDKNKKDLKNQVLIFFYHKYLSGDKATICF